MSKRVLIADPIAKPGLDLLKASCQVTVRPKPTPTELRRIISGYDGLIVRSGTQVTAEILAAARRLTVIGRAGTGVDNIDLDAATRHGVLVVNTPSGNAVSVAEHTLSLMLCLARHICSADASMYEGRWEKRKLMGSELRGKVLGIVGLGHIGRAVAARAWAFEMKVVAHDPLISVESVARLGVALVSLEQLLAESDYVSLHAPSTERTRGMIGARELERMKPSARLINCARGDLVDEDALVDALRAGQIAGAALDVFTSEPGINPALCTCPNLLLTPHLGASTEEAQAEAATQVAQQVIDVLKGRPARHPVNVPTLSPEENAFLQPYLDLGRRLGQCYAQLAENSLNQIEVTYAGNVAEHDTSLVTNAVLLGLLREATDEPVNLINARLVARQRGLIIGETRTSEAQAFSDLIVLRARTATGDRTLCGSIMRGQPHIVRVDDYWFDFVAEGPLLITEHVEQSGIIGEMGTLLDKAGLSISFIQVGRQRRGGPGLMVLGLDDRPSREVLAQVMTMSSIRRAHLLLLDA